MSQDKITSLTFWLLVLAIWALAQAPYAHIPVNFLGTWVHELGHGLGALMTGGHFEKMIISKDLSGTAYTGTYGPGGRIAVIVTGLLAPALAGSIMLIMVRGFGRAGMALFLLALALIFSGTIWAGDMFTRLTVMGTGIVMILLAFKAPSTLRAILAQVIAITFAISAVGHIDYFFMKGGEASGRPVTSDTLVLSELTGFPHLALAIVITIVSLAILFLAFRLSETLWKIRIKRERRKGKERRDGAERRT